LQEDGAGFGEPQGTADALEKLDAERALEDEDVAVDGGGSDIKTAAGSANGLGLRNRSKIAVGGGDNGLVGTQRPTPLFDSCR
jgi:hypothetical protein